jgi:transcriptional regulator with XRE-family HTH domain
MTTTVPVWTIGDRLRKARTSAGLSTKDLADALGVHSATVSRFEADGAVPRRGYVTLWALRCGVSVEWLREGVEPDDGPDDGPDDSGGVSARLLTKWYPASRMVPVAALAG